MKSFLLKNSNNMQVEVLNWGARIAAIRVPNSKGDLVNTVLGYKQSERYRTDPFNMGSTIGRYANRISNASFLLDGKLISLTANERKSQTHLHGGLNGFDKKYWEVAKEEAAFLELTLSSPDGEEGYPGNMEVSCRFELTENNQLILSFHATSDQPTIVNLTNHSYFNLSDKQQIIDSHEITVAADSYTPLNKDHLPIAPFVSSVEQTVYDLRKPTSLEQLKKKICNTNYFVNQQNTLKEMVVLREKISGRCLKISSDYPSLQLYFAEFLQDPFKPFQGICCEPHYAPNSPNIKTYPSVLLRQDEEYNHKIIYSFENF
ncbi:MAG: aldose epimerase family protein [Sphingobacterium sp.]